jgi:hypothetical protein
MMPSSAWVSLQVWAMPSISGMFTLETLITSLDSQLFPACKRGAQEAGSLYPVSYWKRIHVSKKKTVISACFTMFPVGPI